MCSCQRTLPEVSPDTRFIRLTWQYESQSGGHGTVVPPVPIPNTEVKRCCADDSMAKGYAKVGRCQIKHHPASRKRCGVFCVCVARARGGICRAEDRTDRTDRTNRTNKVQLQNGDIYRLKLRHTAGSLSRTKNMRLFVLSACGEIRFLRASQRAVVRQVISGRR
jgi:hypothetical protein